MTVTEVKQTRGERCVLVLSDGSVIRTTLSVVADHSLYAGRELSEAELAEVAGASRLERAKVRAMNMISARPMSCRELYDRLAEKGETEQDAAACVEYLLDLHFLNDADYAAMTVRHYAAKGYGARRIRDELYRRKVPRELWDEALEQLPEQDGEIDRLLSHRLRGAAPDDRAAIKKAGDALVRRGFSWEDIKEAIERWRAANEE
ncbi:MAG: recombination regulator RecX [Butyricicoccus sp.]|nr:recombination regulator RecX [Butyricicoccus sp.]